VSFLDTVVKLYEYFYYLPWEAEEWPLKDVHILISGTCEYVALYSKRDSADNIKKNKNGEIILAGTMSSKGGSL
jgi:hypothetical protein